MKIGILTLPLWNNYGGIIQAYALQKTLKDMGYDVTLINARRPKPKLMKRLKLGLIRVVKKTLRNQNFVVYPDHSQKNIISKNTLHFVQNEIVPITSEVSNNTAYGNLNRNFDVFIVGSDQVWRPSYTPNILNYFLDFSADDKIRISYGASFGTDRWEFSPEEYSACVPLIKRFRAVSVRESSALRICQEKFNTSAMKVLDPTMLLDKNHYRMLCEKYNAKKSNGNLFSYILDNSTNNNEIIEFVSRSLKLSSFKVMPKPFDLNFSISKSEYIYPPLTDWLKAFDDAEFVIADSFHGCVFSIIFNKPFIAIGNKERGLTRFHSLLETFQLEDRPVFSIDDLSSELLDNAIDWDKINQILEVEKNKSGDFLKKALL